ncbi:MAG: hypothetical protein IPP38_11590 [Bacteroidetes bacterium]|nr:hypothetical protein [Bacteroidota bacterium]
MSLTKASALAECPSLFQSTLVGHLCPEYFNKNDLFSVDCLLPPAITLNTPVLFQSLIHTSPPVSKIPT